MNKFKQTEIGLIPEDWEVVRVEEVAKIIKGISWQKNEAIRSLFEDQYLLRALSCCDNTPENIQGGM